MSSTMKKRRTIFFLVSAIILAIITVSSYLYFATKDWKNKIYPNVKVENVDLGGKTKEEATKILKDKYEGTIGNTKINFKVNDKTYTINYSQLGVKCNIPEAVNKAFAYGKDANIISKYNLIHKAKDKNFKLKNSYDEKALDKIIETKKKEIDKKPKNPGLNFNGGSFNVISGVNGFELDKEKLKKDIAVKLNSAERGTLNVQASIKDVKPKASEESLKAVNTKIASFSTNYKADIRSTNIVVATRDVNGTVIMPGETFSFNDIVGDSTKAKGYVEAPIIVNQKVVPGLGGGVCQVSTTLYNAALLANMQIVQRSHHTYPSSYVKKGLDATISYGSLDLKFKNNLSYPVYIQGITGGSTVTFNIYSNEKLKNTRCELSTNLYETVQAKTVYQNDSSLPAGSTETVKRPRTGYKVKTYRSVYKNGNLEKKELISNDYYIAINGVVKRGTK